MALATHSAEIKSEAKTDRPTMSFAPALATLGFLKDAKLAEETPSHQIRTPLHGITTGIEALQRTCPTIFATASDTKVELATQLREIEEGLATIEQGVEELKKITSPHAAADRLEMTSPIHQTQFKAFTVDKVHEALFSLDVQVKLLQDVQKKVLVTLANRAELSKEALSGQLQTLAESTQTLLKGTELSTATLIKAVGQLTGSSKVKETDSSSRVSLYSLGSCPHTTKLALVVDDNTVNQKALVNHLKCLGYQSQVANNGQEAVELVKKGQFETIFMDINMPIMDGFEATRLIRLHDKVTPIICVSANVDESYRTQAHACGINDFLAKPFSRLDISSMLEKYAGYHPSLSSFPLPSPSAPPPDSANSSPIKRSIIARKDKSEVDKETKELKKGKGEKRKRGSLAKRSAFSPSLSKRPFSASALTSSLSTPSSFFGSSSAPLSPASSDAETPIVVTVKALSGGVSVSLTLT